MNEPLPDPLADALAIASAPPREEAPDPAMRALDDQLEAELMKFRSATHGADPVLDQGLTALERRSFELDRVVDHARRLRAQASNGVVPAHVAEAAIAKTEEEVRRGNRLVLRAAEEAAKVARERLVGELLPEPEPGDRTSEVKADLRDALASYTDPEVALERAFDDALKAKSALELRLLAGRWGERAFRARGGTEEAWNGIRRAFFEKLANQAKAEDPRGRATKAWSIVLGRDVEKLMTVMNVELERKAEKVRR